MRAPSTRSARRGEATPYNCRPWWWIRSAIEIASEPRDCSQVKVDVAVIAHPPLPSGKRPEFHGGMDRGDLQRLSKDELIDLVLRNHPARAVGNQVPSFAMYFDEFAKAFYAER